MRGDLGRSIQYDVPVGGLIASRLRVTLPLTLLAAGFMAAVALPLGMFAATHRHRLGDYVAMVVSQLGIAIPSFWAGLLLILLFAVRLGWVEAGGFAGWEAGPWPAIRRLARSYCRAAGLSGASPRSRAATRRASSSPIRKCSGSEISRSLAYRARGHVPSPAAYIR